MSTMPDIYNLNEEKVSEGKRKQTKDRLYRHHQ